MSATKLRLICALMLAGTAFGGASGAADSVGLEAAELEFMTGAEPLDEAEYDQLPKLEKFRAWLPKKVDLTSTFPKPGFQGRQPSCVAWATTYAAHSFLHGQELGKQPTTAAEQMSPAYVYNRLRPRGSQCNKSIKIIDALNFLEREGSVTLAEFPDEISRCTIPAPEALQRRAASYRLDGWRAIERAGGRTSTRAPVVLDDIKGAISRAEPVVFAMPVMPDFKAHRGEGVYQHLSPERSNYHAMAVIGYDEDKQAFRIINSWSDAWGDKGYAWVGYDTFKLLVTEAYALRDARPPAPAGLQKPAALSPRQRLDAVVANVPCGSVRVGNSAGRMTVSGFVGSEDALGQLRSAAMAVDPRANLQVQQRPWPQCEAELTLAAPLSHGGVSLTAKSADGKVRGGDPVSMRSGEIFGISAETPAGKPHLSIVYLQADGSAVELYRGTPGVAGQRGSVTIGLQGAREAQFKVGPPYGDEVVLALASERPLFGDELKDYGTEREFLTALRAKLSGLPRSDVAAAVLRLRTRT